MQKVKRGGERIRVMAPPSKIIAQNKKARFNYFIEDTFEAGLVLYGSEVKSLRQGKGSISESYACNEGGDEFFLINAFIPEYSEANRFNHHPRRSRKLLLHRQEINRLGDINVKACPSFPARPVRPIRCM